MTPGDFWLQEANGEDEEVTDSCDPMNGGSIVPLNGFGCIYLCSLLKTLKLPKNIEKYPLDQFNSIRLGMEITDCQQVYGW